MTEPATYRDLAERSWAWVQKQVRWDEDGPWLRGRADQIEPDDLSYEMHSGVGGLAHVLAEIRLTRELSGPEQELASGIAESAAHRIPGETEYDYFGGLVSTIGILTALDARGSDLAVARLTEIATLDG